MSIHEVFLSDEKMIILARHSITSQNPLFQTNCNCLANDLQAVLLLNPVFMNYERRIKGVRVESLYPAVRLTLKNRFFRISN